MSRWRFLLLKLSKKLWLRSALYAVLGITVALLAAWFSPLVPKSVAKPFGGGAVTGLMNILASSLLAVATFSVTAMLAAFTNISQGATPRAAILVAANRQAQGALATFVGAFLYAVVGYSALGTGYYGAGGRAILFFVTLVMLAVVAVTLLRWLDQLLRLARVDHAIVAVEKETTKAMAGIFGARAPHRQPTPAADAVTVSAGTIGYVQNIDVEALKKIAKTSGLRVWIRAVPGTFTLADTVLAEMRGVVGSEIQRDVRKAFTLGEERSFAQDPQFGLVVLSEIASRALSPGVNNPGVAKDVITSIVRLLDCWMALSKQEPCSTADRVFWCRSSITDLIEDALLSVSIDGATSVPVAIRLQNVLAALARSAGLEDREAIIRFAREALQRSENAITHDPDRTRVRLAAGL